MRLYSRKAHSEEHNHQQSLLMLGYKALKYHVASHTFNPVTHYFNYFLSHSSIILFVGSTSLLLCCRDCDGLLQIAALRIYLKISFIDFSSTLLKCLMDG